MTDPSGGDPPAAPAGEMLGIDIGGSGIKGAPVDTAHGRLTRARQRIPTPDPATPAAVVAIVAELVEGFAWEGPVGCTFPGVVRGGVICTAANVDRTWIGVDAAAEIASATGCHAQVLNDADAAGLAEARHGAAVGVPGLVIVVTLGTGIGTALIHDGRLVPNSELGHLFLSDGEEAEHVAAARVRKEQGLSWKQWAARVDGYLHELERLLWPDLIVIGGGVSKRFDDWSSALDLATPVVPATLRNNAGIVGAAMAAGEARRS